MGFLRKSWEFTRVYGVYRCRMCKLKFYSEVNAGSGLTGDIREKSASEHPRYSRLVSFTFDAKYASRLRRSSVKWAKLEFTRLRLMLAYGENMISQRRIPTNCRIAESFRSSIGNNFPQNRSVNSKSLSARWGFPWSDLRYLSSEVSSSEYSGILAFDCPSIYGNYPCAGWWSFIIVRWTHIQRIPDVRSMYSIYVLCLDEPADTSWEKAWVFAKYRAIGNEASALITYFN